MAGQLQISLFDEISFFAVKGGLNSATVSIIPVKVEIILIKLQSLDGLQAKFLLLATKEGKIHVLTQKSLVLQELDIPLPFDMQLLSVGGRIVGDVLLVAILMSSTSTKSTLNTPIVFKCFRMSITTLGILGSVESPLVESNGDQIAWTKTSPLHFVFFVRWAEMTCM